MSKSECSSCKHHIQQTGECPECDKQVIEFMEGSSDSSGGSISFFSFQCLFCMVAMVMIQQHMYLVNNLCFDLMIAYYCPILYVLGIVMKKMLSNKKPNRR